MSVELLGPGTVALTTGTPCICADCRGVTRFHLERLRRYPDGRWRLRCYGCQRLAKAREWREENQRTLLLQELYLSLRRELKRRRKLASQPPPRREWLRLPAGSELPAAKRLAVLQRQGDEVTLTFWRGRRDGGMERFKSTMQAQAQAYHWLYQCKKADCCVVELGDLE